MWFYDTLGTDWHFNSYLVNLDLRLLGPHCEELLENPHGIYPFTISALLALLWVFTQHGDVEICLTALFLIKIRVFSLELEILDIMYWLYISNPLRLWKPGSFAGIIILHLDAAWHWSTWLYVTNMTKDIEILLNKTITTSIYLYCIVRMLSGSISPFMVLVYNLWHLPTCLYDSLIHRCGCVPLRMPPIIGPPFLLRTVFPILVNTTDWILRTPILDIPILDGLREAITCSERGPNVFEHATFRVSDWSARPR